MTLVPCSGSSSRHVSWARFTQASTAQADLPPGTEPAKGTVAAVGAKSLVQQGFRDAEQCGWSECPLPLADVLDVIGERSEVIPSRPGDPPVGVLQAIDQHHARRLSLSGRFGRGVFPLHTDGAHLPDPPDAVLLEFRQPTSRAPTLLFTPRLDEVRSAVSHALHQGVFDTGVGRATFLAHAVTEQRLRFDPMIMEPRDALARLVMRFFGECAAHSIKYRARAPGMTLIINNRRTLHGRAAVPDSISREVERAMIRWTPA